MSTYGKLLPLTSLLQPVLEMAIPFLPSLTCMFELAGVGTTSRALRALSNDGKEYIIKMYVQKYVDGGKQISKIDFTSATKGSVERQGALSYHELYPELRNFISTKVLNGYHCVILPYFSPIPKEEWLNSIESINDILKKFKGGHCQFVESDMLWQHLGKFNGQVYLFDLADLGEGDNSSLPFALYVEKHCQTLLERLSSSEQA
jgi:hypothetical protein